MKFLHNHGAVFAAYYGPFLGIYLAKGAFLEAVLCAVALTYCLWEARSAMRRAHAAEAAPPVEPPADQAPGG